MTKTYLLLAASGLSLAACGGQTQTAKQTANQTGDASGALPDMMASAATPGVVPGGAVDVLQREGWRVDPAIQQADASETTGRPS